jgi:2-iminobutanoate/2-iminopropanoate deaminase
MAHLSQFSDHGDTVYFSGQIGFESPGKLAAGGISGQTEQILRNVDELLAQTGLARDNIAKATVWLTDGQDFAVFNSLYAAWFGDHRPARSTTIAGLVVPGAVIEIEFIARRA